MLEQVNIRKRAPKVVKPEWVLDPVKKIFTFHEDHTAAESEWIFVFGSNLAGFHGAGAALAAYKYYGARLGVGTGPTGLAYAIPTKDQNLKVRSIMEIEVEVRRFSEYTQDHPELKFFVTRVGCGLAGYRDEAIAPLFRRAINCSFAKEWEPYL